MPTDPDIMDDPQEERRTRRKRVATVAIPDEIHALCVLTGQDPEAVIETIIGHEVAALVAKAKSVMAAN